MIWWRGKGGGGWETFCCQWRDGTVLREERGGGGGLSWLVVRSCSEICAGISLVFTIVGSVCIMLLFRRLLFQYLHSPALHTHTGMREKGGLWICSLVDFFFQAKGKVPVERFESVCAETSAALQREQALQTELAHQSRQVEEAMKR